MADALFREVPEDDDEKEDNEEEDEEERRRVFGMKTAPLREVFIPLGSGRFLRRQTELDHSPPVLRRKPLYTFRERIRYMKLNYFCHGSVLQIACSFTTDGLLVRIRHWTR